MKYDINGSTTAKYTMGLGIDEPISIKTANTTGYYHTDGLGTVREITSSTGTILNSYSYDAWGNIQSSSETIAQPFTFTAREWDSDASLYYYRARYMDAGVGRFTTIDPALGDADDPFSFHGYIYVSNNPMNFIDPYGLESYCVWTSFSVNISIGLGFAFISQMGLCYDECGQLYFTTRNCVCSVSGLGALAGIGIDVGPEESEFESWSAGIPGFKISGTMSTDSAGAGYGIGGGIFKNYCVCY